MTPKIFPKPLQNPSPRPPHGGAAEGRPPFGGFGEGLGGMVPWGWGWVGWGVGGGGVWDSNLGLAADAPTLSLQVPCPSVEDAIIGIRKHILLPQVSIHV